MTAKATKTAPRTEPPTIESLRRYTPEEVEALGLSPFTARTLRNKVRARELYHHRDGVKITFTLDDLRRNAELGATAPLAKSA